MIRSRVAGAFEFLVELECNRALYETLLKQVLMHGSSGTMIWIEKERFKIRAVQMDSIRSMRKIDKFLNARIWESSGVTKGGNERIDEGVLR